MLDAERRMVEKRVAFDRIERGKEFDPGPAAMAAECVLNFNHLACMYRVTKPGNSGGLRVIE